MMGILRFRHRTLVVLYMEAQRNDLYHYVITQQSSWSRQDYLTSGNEGNPIGIFSKPKKSEKIPKWMCDIRLCSQYIYLLFYRAWNLLYYLKQCSIISTYWHVYSAPLNVAGISFYHLFKIWQLKLSTMTHPSRGYYQSTDAEVYWQVTPSVDDIRICVIKFREGNIVCHLCNCSCLFATHISDEGNVYSIKRWTVDVTLHL